VAATQASGANTLGVLPGLASDERAPDLAVRRDVRAVRVEAARRNVDDLLGDAREVGRLASESYELRGVLGTEYLHPEAVVETTLLRRLDDRRIADLSRGRQIGRAHV